MSDVRLFEIDPFGSDRQRVSTLLESVFKRRSDKAVERLQLLQTSMPSLFVAAEVNGEIVGFSAFMAHSMLVGCDRRTAHQAVDVATSPAQRGKGIFASLVKFAEGELTRRKAAFIFGFPNPAAYPIWTTKLGYDEVGLARWRSPTSSWLDAVRISGAGWPSLPLAIGQDDEELIASKKKLYGDAVTVVKNASGILWGMPQRFRAGPVEIPFFHIGGFSFDERDGFLAAHKEALARAGRPLLTRFEAVASNPWLKQFQGMKIVPGMSSKMIYKPLDLDEAMLGDGLGIFAGIKDTF